MQRNLFANDSYKNWGLGLSEFDNQFPLALNHLSFRPMSPSGIEKGEHKLKANYIVTNTFIQKEGEYTIDGEYRVTNFELAYGATDSLEVSFRLPFIWRGGGYLDSFVDDFHQTLGLPRGGRENYEEDRFGMFGLNKDDSGFAILETGVEAGDLTLSSKYAITDGDEARPAWSLLTELRLPTAAKESYGQESIDLMVGLVGSKAISQFYIYWGAAYIFFGDTEIKNITYETNHFEGFVGAEYPLNDKLSLNAALYAASPLIESIEGFPRYATYLDTGLKYKLSENSIFEFLLRENPTPSGSTADFSLLFGIEHIIR